ncbi:uncharacterized membrane protein YhaH (DUF805 family) [Oxalobacteraceae bacterium GrIS 2.11]
MNFTESVSVCFSKYADFNGRATRSEYWWFVLFIFAVHAVLSLTGSHLIRGLFGFATLVPHLAVGARRLHDTDRSGWWQLLYFVPLIGWIFLLIWKVQESDVGANRFDNIG